MRFPAEEVAAHVDASIFPPRNVREVERGDTEHLSRALRVARGDDGRVDPKESVFVEVAMDSLREAVPHILARMTGPEGTAAA